MFKPVVAPLVSGKGKLLLVPVSRDVYSSCEDGRVRELGIEIEGLPPLVFALGWLPDGIHTRFGCDKGSDREQVRAAAISEEARSGQPSLATLYRLNNQQRRMLYDWGFAKYTAADMLWFGHRGGWQDWVGGYVCLVDTADDYEWVKRRVLK